MRQTLLWSLIATALAIGAFSYWQWGPEFAISTEFVFLCLALGFWVTEMLVGVFTGVKKANATAIALLFFVKLGWWTALFWGARRIPQGHDGAVALGIGGFLLALLFSTLRHYGVPTISDVETPRDP